MEISLIVIFVCALLATGLSLRFGLASRLAIDQPNARSLHSTPTPRVGGLLALPWALVVGCYLYGQYAAPLLLAAGLCLFSFVDDRAGLSVVWRLLVHLGVAAAATWVVGVDKLPIMIVLVFAISWMINLYNFMDGADGLAGGMAAIGFSGYGIAALASGNHGLAGVSFSIVASALGFLAFNFPPARIFMGDAGSTTLGFLAGTVGLLGWQEGAWPIWFPAIVFSPFVVDATYTLLVRALRREKIWQAHREHCYQKLVRMGWSHRRLAVSEYMLMIVAGGVALALRELPTSMLAVGVIALVLGYAVIIAGVVVKWRRFQELSESR